MMKSMHISRMLLVLLLALPGALPATAQAMLHVDARRYTAPEASSFVGGTARSPSGEVLGLNSRYLTLDGKPWLPVMGEFHYSRVPRAEWEEEILKAKASGVNILSTYVIWIHHEEVEGHFDWTGNRDLREFVELCRKHHMLVYVRIGPWAHGEVRHGGFPDWLLAKAPLSRRNDPVYLKYVAEFYKQIGQQLRGELWKDGGPVVGVQLENEYARKGPGMGAEHILTLKQVALDAGLDVPFYSVTGWNGATVPKSQTLGVFGGYPDQPWASSLKSLPPQEVYAFRFGSRVTGDMGMMGAHPAGAPGESYDYPFMTAEMGGGIEDTYHRRPVISADDVAAMVPVMLGSGVNLYGSYMFQGGQNPDGQLSTLQESQRTGYPNDVPEKSYDFQAPLGEYGQERPVLRKLKIFQYFMNDFGPELAPMEAFAPEEQPRFPQDLSVARIAVRAKGDQGYLFFNNYVRDASMPARTGFQVQIDLPSGKALVPAHPITLPSGAYGIWPVNMPLGAATLRYATAQPMLKFAQGGRTRYVFVAQPGVPVEFSLTAPRESVHVHSGRAESVGGGLLLTESTPSFSRPAFTVGASDSGVEVFLLSAEDAENVWRYQEGTNTHLILTADEFWANDDAIHLDRMSSPSFRFAIAPPAAVHPVSGAPLRAITKGGQTVVASDMPASSPEVKVLQTKQAGLVPPVLMGTSPSGRPGSPTVPEPPVIAVDAATWTVSAAGIDWAKVKDVFLEIRYQGDLARLSAGDHLLDDDFYNGLPWQVGLRRYRDDLASGLTLSVLPLRLDSPVFLEERFRPKRASGQVVALESVTVVPQYEITVSLW